MLLNSSNVNNCIMPYFLGEVGAIYKTYNCSDKKRWWSTQGRFYNNTLLLSAVFSNMIVLNINLKIYYYAFEI